MALDVTSLLPSLYRALVDTDRTDPAYSDDDLIGLLKDAAVMIKGKLDETYTITANVDSWSIDPSPNDIIQMLIVIKAALLQKTYEVRYSYHTEAFSITRTSKKEELDSLNKELDDLVMDYDYVVGTSRTEWDDYLEKIDELIDTLSATTGYPHTV